MFVVTAVGFFAYWVLADPTYEESPEQSEWVYVLGFSGTLLSLAFALPRYAFTVGGRWVRRLSLLAAAGIGAASVANVVEDGFGVSWIFFITAGSAAIALCALVALAAVIAAGKRGRHRLLAVDPLATAAAIVFFVAAGGVIMLVTWLTAAGVAVARRKTTRVRLQHT